MKTARKLIGRFLTFINWYKYKIVYTETDIKGECSFKKRFMYKLPVYMGNEGILLEIPTPHGSKYKTPEIMFWTRSKKNCFQRIELGKDKTKESYHTVNMFKEHYK